MKLNESIDSINTDYDVSNILVELENLPEERIKYKGWLKLVIGVIFQSLIILLVFKSQEISKIIINLIIISLIIMYLIHLMTFNKYTMEKIYDPPKMNSEIFNKLVTEPQKIKPTIYNEFFSCFCLFLLGIHQNDASTFDAPLVYLEVFFFCFQASRVHQVIELKNYKFLNSNLNSNIKIDQNSIYLLKVFLKGSDRGIEMTRSLKNVITNLISKGFYQYFKTYDTLSIIKGIKFLSLNNKGIMSSGDFYGSDYFYFKIDNNNLNEKIEEKKCIVSEIFIKLFYLVSFVLNLLFLWDLFYIIKNFNIKVKVIMLEYEYDVEKREDIEFAYFQKNENYYTDC
jgi:hypothetical protein